MTVSREHLFYPPRVNARSGLVSMHNKLFYKKSRTATWRSFFHVFFWK